MKPSTCGGIFTLFCADITEASVLRADREREKERVDLLITWVGISTSRGGWQVQKASAYSKKVDWILKKQQRYYVSAHFNRKKTKTFSHKCAICCSIIQSSSERQKKMPPLYSISTHADFYLSVYNNNSAMRRSTADPIITLLQPFVWIYSQHDLMSEVLPCVGKQFYWRTNTLSVPRRNKKHKGLSLLYPAGVTASVTCKCCTFILFSIKRTH